MMAISIGAKGVNAMGTLPIDWLVFYALMSGSGKGQIWDHLA
jgi:hypothetical protein